MVNTLPNFETGRLRLRPRIMADYAACLAMDRDPLVTRYIAGPWADPTAHEQFLEDRIRRDFGPGLGYWSIFPRNEPDRFVGWILLIPYDGVGPEIEIGWRLVRGTWGKGYATEATQPVVRHAFETIGLGRLVADIDPRNQPSMHVAEKIGMRFVGEGRHGDMACMSYVMTRNDFLHMPQVPGQLSRDAG